MSSATSEYRILLEDLLRVGVSAAAPRGFDTRELISYTSRVDMAKPIVGLPDRKLDYNFMAAEAFWILSGSDKLNHPVIKKNLTKYSDNGKVMAGAYGPPFRAQVEYAIAALMHDRDTRQAVITLWRENPSPSKDIPCTVAVQFMIREEFIHTNVFMRSSDAWLGWPYDVFTFTMMTCYILSRLPLASRPKLGTLSLTAGSQHLYEKNIDQAKAVCDSVNNGDNLTICLYEVMSPVCLMKRLDIIRNAPNDKVLTCFKENLCAKP